MTTPYSESPPPPHFIEGPEGYLRCVVVVPGRHGAARVERMHVNNRNEALKLCTESAARAMVNAIAAHYPLIELGYKIVKECP